MCLWRKKKQRSWDEVVRDMLWRKKDWLFNVLFNELPEEHPELWSWLSRKLEEYEQL